MIQKSIYIMGVASLIIFLFSCEKELKCENAISLTDENTYFIVGKWKWEYTTRRVYDKGNGSVVEDTIYNNDIENEYIAEFLEEGKVSLYLNEDLNVEYCIYDTNNTSANNSHVHMNLFLNNDDEESILKYIYTKNSGTTIITIKDTEFPYSYEENDYEQIFYNNYFQKQ